MGKRNRLLDLSSAPFYAVERRVSMKRLAQMALVLGIFLLMWCGFVLLTRGTLSDKGVEVVTNIKDISSFVAVFFSLASILLVLENLKAQGRVSEVNMMLTQKSHFEKTFFDLIALQNQISRDIDTSVTNPANGEDVQVKGRGFFDDIADAVTYEFSERAVRDRRALVNVYLEYYTVHNSDMAHYYRNLYTLVRYVVEHPYFVQIAGYSNLKLMSVEGYVRIIRAQLTNAELTCLALNGMIEPGKPFAELINEHQLLRNLNFELSMPSDHASGVPAPDLLAAEYKHLKPILDEQRRHAAEAGRS